MCIKGREKEDIYQVPTKPSVRSDILEYCGKIWKRRKKEKLK